MRKALFAIAVVVAGLGTVVADEKLVSGPQVDTKLAGPFHPLNINGEAAGKKNCLYCANGDNPVAMIFARSADSKETAKLIAKIEAATKENAKADMGSFVVFLGDEEKLEMPLKEMAKSAKLEKCVLSIDNEAGPKGYKVAKEADVTVVLYKDRTVKANWAFKKGELKDADIETIIKDISKITK
jgi:hypothetical protein